MTLKECPFCKETKQIYLSEEPGDRCIECYKCGATGPYAKTPEEAAKLWNRRDGDVPG